MRQEPPVLLATTATFLLALAGQFDFTRVGIDLGLPVPERLVGAVIIAAFFLPVLQTGAAPRSFTSTLGKVLFAELAVISLLVLSSLWAPAESWPTRQPEVVMDLVVLALSCLVLWAALRVAPMRTLQTWMWLSVGAGVVFALAGLLVKSGDRISAFGGGPNVFGRITGVAMICLVGLAIAQRRSVFWLSPIPLLVVATVLSGSRGAMLSTFVAGLILLPVVVRRLSSRILLVAAAALPVTWVIYNAFAVQLRAAVDVRIIDLTLTQRSDSGRTPLYRAAISIFEDNPVYGAGLRGFESLYGYQHDDTYPHNLPLQLAAETGVVGLLLMGFMLVAIYGRVRPRHLSDPLVATTVAVSVLYFISAQFSGDYYDARFFWFFGLFVAVSTSLEPKESLPQEAERSSRMSPLARQHL